MTRLAVTLALLAACSNNSDPEDRRGGTSTPKAAASARSAPPASVEVAPPAKPLLVSWSDANFQQKFTIEGGGEGAATANEEGIRITLHKLDGASYEIGGKKGMVDGNHALITVDPPPALGAVAYKDIEKVDTKLTLKLSLRDGRTGEIALPPISYKFVLKDLFAKIENRPITFGAEPEDPKPGDSLFYPKGDIVGTIIGRAATLQEIDFIATQEELEATGTKRCSGYTGSISTLTINLKPTEVTIWDRRTGELVEKKTFPPKTECPMMAYTRAGQTSVDSYPATESIKKWLKTRIKR